jgi:hypothetical protein
MIEPQDVPRARRAWTARMEAVLGLSRRRIQKLVQAGAPDATDEELATSEAWSAHERRWRTWISLSPRWASLSRRLRAPADLDSGHAAALTVDPVAVPGLSPLDAEKLARATADRQRSQLALARERGEVIERPRAKACLVASLQGMVAGLADLPGHIASLVPLDQRTVVRAAAKTACEAERVRLERRTRDLWREHVPELITTSIPKGTPS